MLIFLIVFNHCIIFAETAPELESSATPLMLTGIPGTDFALTRDFLVMQDDQINVINTFKNQNIEELEDNPIILPSITEDANKENNKLALPECNKEIRQIAKEPPSKEKEKKKIVEKKDIRRSKRHITDFCKYNIYSKYVLIYIFLLYFIYYSFIVFYILNRHFYRV